MFSKSKVSSLDLMYTDIRGEIGTREARKQFREEVTRKHFITRQDCRNITRRVRDFSSHRHTEDAISTYRFVHELQKENPTPVLLYKQQFQAIPDHPSLTKDTFLIVVMTEFQAEMFTKFSYRIQKIQMLHGI